MQRADWNIIEADDEMSFPHQNERVLAFSPIDGIGLASHSRENKKVTCTDPATPHKHYWQWVNKRKGEGPMEVYDITHWIRVVTP